jgi:hypothetical protein
LVAAISASDFNSIATDRENRNKTEMKIRPVDLNFPVIGLAGVANVIMINIPGYSDVSYPKNVEHLV